MNFLHRSSPVFPDLGQSIEVRTSDNEIINGILEARDEKVWKVREERHLFTIEVEYISWWREDEEP